MDTIGQKNFLVPIASVQPRERSVSNTYKSGLMRVGEESFMKIYLIYGII